MGELIRRTALKRTDSALRSILNIFVCIHLWWTAIIITLLRVYAFSDINKASDRLWWHLISDSPRPHHSREYCYRNAEQVKENCRFCMKMAGSFHPTTLPDLDVYTMVIVLIFSHAPVSCTISTDACISLPMFSRSFVYRQIAQP